MLPGTYDLVLYRGDTARLQFTLWQDAAKTQPLHLDGVVPAAQIRDKPDSSEVVIELICEISGTNTVGVTVPAGAAGALKTKGAWDLQLTFPNGDIQTVVAGQVYTTFDITRPPGS